MGEIIAANIITGQLVSEPTGHEVGKDEVTGEKRKAESQKELLDKNDNRIRRMESEGTNRDLGAHSRVTLVYLL